MNSTVRNLKDLLKNKSLYEFKLCEYINSSTVENKIFGNELINIKIIYISSNLNSENGISVAIFKNNEEVENNKILDLDEGIKIETINKNNDVHFGKYYIEFVGIIKEPLTYEDLLTYTDEILIFGINLKNNEISKYYKSCYNENLYQFNKTSVDACNNNLYIDESLKICYKDCKESENENKILTYKNLCVILL